MQKSKLNLRKFLGQPSATSETSTTNAGSEPRPNVSQYCSYDAGASLTCIDRSPDGRQAIIAGPKVFKILRVVGPSATEELDLRATLTAHAATTSTGSAPADQLNIRAVRWLHGVMDSTIVTASGNGRITVYDLKRGGDGFEVTQIQDHARQVHKLAVNPFKCNWLLTASQDGTVKSFDLRNTMLGNGGSVVARQSFKCNADAVRDVVWSPTDGMEFACCTDAGMVQKWDIRKPTAPVIKISAHQSPCFSISWHPDGKHLVSGGTDHHCYVWNLSKQAERTQRPKYSVVTPAPVAHVSWRPPTWSHTAQARRAAQVAVSYEDGHSNRTQNAAVHIWDVARPALPFKELDHWDSAPRGLLWNSRDILWGVSKDNHFVQSDVAFAPRLIDRKSLSTFSLSHTGELAMLLESRQPPRRRQASHHSLESTPVSFTSGTGPALSLSRSDSEEDVVGSFLAPKQRPGHQRRLSQRTTLPISSTPPNPMTHVDTKLLSLDDAVQVTGEYCPRQILSTGQAPAAHAQALHDMLSRRYIVRMEKVFRMARGAPLNQHLMPILEYYAKCAEHVGHYRLAQTWRLLAFVLNLLMSRRAEFHRKSRLAMKSQEARTNPKGSPAKTESSPSRKADDVVDAKKVIPHTEVNAKSMITEEIESTSNVATPLIRPLRDIQSTMSTQQHLEETDNFRLPPADIDSPPGGASGQDTAPVISRMDVSEDMNHAWARDKLDTQIEVAARHRKKPLQYSIAETTSQQQPRLTRHDSGESFQMFSTSGDSHVAHSTTSARLDSQSTLSTMPSFRQSIGPWENSLRTRGVLAPAPPAASESSDDFTSPSKSSGFQDFAGMTDARRPHTRVSPPMLRLQEASAGGPSDLALRPRSASNLSDDPNIVADDWLPWPEDPEFVIDPINPSTLIQRTIEFECQTGSMNATACVLLLRPFLALNTISTPQAQNIIRQQHHRLMQMKCFTAAALLRKLCVPLYPSVYSNAQSKVSVGFFCTSCNRPLENDPMIPSSVWRCPRCEQTMAGCAVCKHREVQQNIGYEYSGASSTRDSSMWWLCPGCGHGGHTICMQAWHAGADFSEGSEHSGGACPLEGCLHPCLPGKWREQRVLEKQAAKSRELDFSVRQSVKALGTLGGGGGATPGVRRDRREVPQSRAVDVARLALGANAYAPTTVGGVGKRASIGRVLSSGGMGGYEAG